MIAQMKINTSVGHKEIRAFARGTTWNYLERASKLKLFSGRVLDYGCGPQPYRDLVTGKYFAYDPSSDPGFKFRPMPDGTFDSVLMTYVLGYSFDPAAMLRECASKLKIGGHLVGAYAISWSEIEPSYVCSMNFSGVAEAFSKVPELDLLEHERACSLAIDDFVIPISATFTARKI